MWLYGLCCAVLCCAAVQFKSNQKTTFDLLHEKVNNARWNKAGRPSKSSRSKPSAAAAKSPVESCISRDLLVRVVRSASWATKRVMDQKLVHVEVKRNKFGSVPFPQTLGIPMLPPSEPSPMSVHNTTTHAFYSNDYLADFDSSDLSAADDRKDENDEKITIKNRKHRRPRIINMVQHRDGVRLGSIKMEMVNLNSDGVSPQQVEEDRIPLSLGTGVTRPLVEHSLALNSQEVFNCDENEESLGAAQVSIMMESHGPEKETIIDSSSEEEYHPLPLSTKKTKDKKKKSNNKKTEVDDEEDYDSTCTVLNPLQEQPKDRKKAIEKILFENSEEYFEKNIYLSEKHFDMQIFYDACASLQSNRIITSLKNVKKVIWNVLMGGVVLMNDYTMSATREMTLKDIGHLLVNVDRNVNVTTQGM